MSAVELVEKYTFEDYQTWEDRWELIDGIAYAMAPAPYPKHQRLAVRTWSELDKNLKCRFSNMCEVFISPIDWKVDDTTVVQPDIAIFCEKTAKQYFQKTPIMIVEVLSLSTAQKDTTVKFDLYQKQKVPCYIMINPTNNKAEVYTLKDDKYQLHSKYQDKDIFEFKDNECKTKNNFGEVFS